MEPPLDGKAKLGTLKYFHPKSSQKPAHTPRHAGPLVILPAFPLVPPATLAACHNPKTKAMLHVGLCQNAHFLSGWPNKGTLIQILTAKKTQAHAVSSPGTQGVRMGGSRLGENLSSHQPMIRTRTWRLSAMHPPWCFQPAQLGAWGEGREQN